jgi:hypothetical protein
MNRDEALLIQRPNRSFIPALLLQWGGLVLTAIGAAFLLVVAAYPLGLIRAYPAPPAAAIEGPLGLTRKISDPDILHRTPGEPMQAYLERLTKTVAGSMVHYWTKSDRWTAEDARYTRIGLFDNYLLWIESFLPRYRENFQDYEFVTPGKALMRGYGFCSQASKIVYSILTDQGIAAVIYSAPEHTIVESNGSVLDSDYGVFIPHSLDSIRKDPSLIDRYYANFQPMVPLLRRAYAESWQQLGTARGFRDVRAYEAKFERLKWFPPLMLLALGMAFAAGGTLLDRRGKIVRPASRGIPTTTRG